MGLLFFFLKLAYLISHFFSCSYLRVYLPVITVVPVGPCRELMVISSLLPFITQSSNQQFNFLVPERPSLDVSIQESNFSQTPKSQGAECTPQTVKFILHFLDGSNQLHPRFLDSLLTLQEVLLSSVRSSRLLPLPEMPSLA